MSKLNRTTRKSWNINTMRNLSSREDATVNHEGELSFRLDPLTDLYIRCASSFVSEPKYYTSAKEADLELIKSIHKAIAVDPEFVLQLAVYCREELHLRSIPIILLIEFANTYPGFQNSRKYVARCIQRADELTELVAGQFSRNKQIPRTGCKLPRMLKEGIAKAFPKFTEYQLSKYKKDDSEVKLRDVLRLTHPLSEKIGLNNDDLYSYMIRTVYTNEKKERLIKVESPTNSSFDGNWRRYRPEWDTLNDGTILPAETWEVMRSTGQMSWHDIIYEIFNKDGKVNNYMAIARNIRNILNDSSVTKDDILLYADMLSDRNAVINSKQFPYRFLSAYLVTQDTKSPYQNLILDSLEEAIIHSVNTLPKLDGLTCIASDFSGSMRDVIGQRPSDKRVSYDMEEKQRKYSLFRCDIGQLLGMIANQFCQHTITGIFGDIWKVIPTSKYSGILKTTVDMRNKTGTIVGCSTNGYLVPEYLLTNNIEVDRIFLFTDGQLWNSNGDGKHFTTEFLKYQRKYPNVKLYCFDLTGYGTLMIPNDTRNVCLIGGFSERIFDFIKSFEYGNKDTVLNTIKSIKV